jgi:hypothetical protein
MFKPGDKVICIDNTVSELARKYGFAHSLELGTIYCVRESWKEERQGQAATTELVVLVGQRPMPKVTRTDGSKPARMGWRATRFSLIYRWAPPPTQPKGKRGRLKPGQNA